MSALGRGQLAKGLAVERGGFGLDASPVPQEARFPDAERPHGSRNLGGRFGQEAARVAGRRQGRRPRTPTRSGWSRRGAGRPKGPRGSGIDRWSGWQSRDATRSPRGRAEPPRGLWRRSARGAPGFGRAGSSAERTPHPCPLGPRAPAGPARGNEPPSTSLVPGCPRAAPPKERGGALRGGRSPLRFVRSDRRGSPSSRWRLRAAETKGWSSRLRRRRRGRLPPRAGPSLVRHDGRRAAGPARPSPAHRGLGRFAPRPGP